MFRQMDLLAFVALVAFHGPLVALAGALPPEVAHRREVVKELADPATFEPAVVAGLKDPDPFVRRYALYALYEKDVVRACEQAKVMVNDPSVGVRKTAKSMNREGGAFRENVARSVDSRYDHDVEKVETIRPDKGAFDMAKALPDGTWAEVWFGKPREDLYVWLNGIYLGQFDVDSQLWSEFRLDMTKEVKAPGLNELVIKNAKGETIQRACTVEVLK